jgi:hypothetical protein
MERLCFGTYAKRLQKTLIDSGNEKAAELLLDLITENVDILNRNGQPFVVTSKIASELLTHKVEVHKKIRDASGKPAVMDAARDYFEDAVIPFIMPDMVEDLLADMSQLISADTDIPKRKQSELLAIANADTLAEFLSSVYLYAIKQTNKISVSSTDTEFSTELTPPLSVRSDSIPESDLYLLMEAGSVCQSCGKTLVNIKNGHSLSGYAITEIVPTNPSQEVREELGDLLDSLPTQLSDNRIALCLDCSNRHIRHTTWDECLALKRTKEKLRRDFDAATMLDKMYLEEQIEAVLRKIPVESTDEITETLEYEALRVRDKIHSNVPLIIKTEGFVVQYYQFIKTVFAQMEREGAIDFDAVASDVKCSFRKLESNGYSQEEIYAHLVDWFMKKTNTKSKPPCEIIVAFFVQNCEVFHALSE